jgi:MFS family permease
MKTPRFKLFFMMVLELFIWGAWLPMIFGYLDFLKFDNMQKGWILNAFALGSFLAMFFSTQFADRNFAAEKFMAISHLIGGVALLGLYFTTSFWPFFGLMLIHCLMYVPTLSIANSIAFTHLKDAQNEFGPVRMGGTVGWVLAAWPLFFILGNKTGEDAEALKKVGFLVAGIAELVLAFFSLSLPHTPPKPASASGGSFAFLEAVKLLKVPFILVLFVVTFIDACVHQCYFIWTESFLAKRVGFEARWGMPIMSIGQIFEILTMAVLGYFLKRLGWKKIMILGILGHTVRFAVFALFPDARTFIVLIQVLHGVCYALRRCTSSWMNTSRRTSGRRPRGCSISSSSASGPSWGISCGRSWATSSRPRAGPTGRRSSRCRRPWRLLRRSCSCCSSIRRRPPSPRSLPPIERAAAMIRT